MADDRPRWVREFRDRPAGELLERYRENADLPEVAISALRDELKLRGLDPDSFSATVPRADAAKGEEDVRGEMQPPEDLDLPALKPDDSASEASRNLRICESCKQANHADLERCQNCGAPLTARARDDDERTTGKNAAITPPADTTLLVATLGLVGFAAVVFAAYCAVGGTLSPLVAGLAGVAGAATIVASIAARRRV